MGYNGKGALGTEGSFDSCSGMLCSTTPVRVQGGIEFRSVSVSPGLGGSHTCGVAESGFVYCWGSNAAGQLGRGYTGGVSFEPVRILGQPGEY